jgi:D-sedoheptulose 7-phosphate isomerase
MSKRTEFTADLVERHPLLKNAERDIAGAYDLMENCFRSNGKLLIAGNGGSAADAEHIVGELMKSFVLDRRLDTSFAEKLRAADREKGAFLTERLQGALPAMSLTGQIGLSTAFGNDVDGELVFAQQLYGYGNKGDVFLAISTSGNSRNVIYAAIVAKAKGMQIICLTGANGGELTKYADVAVKVPETETYKVQELHLPIYHSWCLALEKSFFHEENLGNACIGQKLKSENHKKNTDRIRAIIFDIDGVLTDGKVYADAAGNESKVYCLRDADALNELKQRGYLTVCITGEDNAFSERIKKVFAPDEFHAGCKEKLEKLKEFEKRHGLKSENICYIGDGKYDVQAMRYAGLRICPADAADSVKDIADMILHCGGGAGCLDRVLSHLTAADGGKGV